MAHAAVELAPLGVERDGINDVVKPAAGKGETDLPAAYLSYLAALKAAWPDLPDLTVSYRDFGYSATVPLVRREIPNLWTAFREGLTKPFRKAKTKEFKALAGVSGVVRPGEMTLLLAPPGHGKSLLLKGLAGRLQREATNLRGSIRWNGQTAEECAASGFQLSKACAFVEQGDVHFPMLTVRETFAFALRNSNAHSELLGSAEFDAMQTKKVDLMLELLGLKECADTVCGNNMLRGISGGQKKRVTLGEMMITQARALFLDEISTGLDSAATFDIVSALKRWTRVMRGSAYVALLQPAPEVFAMFDNVILMREGQVLFSGSQAELRAHFDNVVRITPNAEVDFADWLVEFLTSPLETWRRDVELQGRPASRVASFRKSFREEERINVPAAALTGAGLAPLNAANGRSTSKVADLADADDGRHSRSPLPTRESTVVFHLAPDREVDEAAEAIAARAENAEGADSAAPLVDAAPAARVASLDSGAPAARVASNKVKGLGQIVSAKDVPLTTAALRRAYEGSRTFQNLQAEISDAESKGPQPGAASESRSAFTTAQFYKSYSRTVWAHTEACLWRQFLFMRRSPTFIIPRVGQAVFMGLVMGSLFWQLGTGPNQFSPRFGLILFGLMFQSFANMAELPLASEFKLVVYKQVDAGFYSPFSYALSVILMHLPLAITEVGIFGTLLWWMSDFNHEPGRYFFFLFVMLLVNLSIGALFRFIAYQTRNRDSAVHFTGPVVVMCVLFGGFLITVNKIPNYMIWLYWLSPFSWALRSGALDEMHSDRYPPGVGDRYLGVWHIDTNDDYRWAGVAYLAGIFLLFLFLGSLALKYKRFWLTSGTRRTHDEVEGEVQPEVVVRVGAKTTSMQHEAEALQAKEDANQLDFERMDLSWRNLKYTVQVKEKNEATGKQEARGRLLLDGINGFARAGELTALMGSSGAGKTTLMDVIAGRKTEGKIEGDIFVNGHKQTFPTFARLNGYCEQQDVHTGTDTVREAIDFSASLRLPATVTPEVRAKFVDQILEDLELTEIAGRLIGDINIEGLSPGELKRVTIGVELASNPVFLFLDEPTSGLDSRAALIVLRVIRKISRRGRSVICTIHQPSAELFCMFDRLLLLKSGGKEVYFGPVGEDGVDVVRYFMEAPIGAEYFRPEFTERQNPASWMLDVIGAGTSAKGKIADYSEVYKNSPLRLDNEAKTAQHCQPRGQPPSFESRFANSYSKQMQAVLVRLFTVYWRDTSYNSTKFFLMAFLGTLLGLIYLRIDDSDESGIVSKISVMFMATGFMGVLQSSNALPIVLRLREVFYRERASNVYAPAIYSTALQLVELPYVFICTALFVIPFYWLVGFESTATGFFRYLLVLYLIALFFTFMGQLFASLMPNIQVATMIQGLCFTFFFLFGGIFIQKALIPKGWVWMYYIDPLPKALIALCVQQFYCADDDPSCPMMDTLQFGYVSKWRYVSEYLVSGKDWEAPYIGWLIFSIGVAAILVQIVIQKVSHVKR